MTVAGHGHAKTARTDGCGVARFPDFGQRMRWRVHYRGFSAQSGEVPEGGVVAVSLEPVWAWTEVDGGAG